jgi:hypothetical protein
MTTPMDDRGSYRSTALVFEWNDNLVGTDQAKVTTHHLIGQVRIGLAWIQQCRAMLELGAFRLKFGKLGLAHFKLLRIAAPGKQAVGTSDRMTGKGADDEQRHGGPHRPADQSNRFVALGHGLTRIRKTP